jgi:hypothetical protein
MSFLRWWDRMAILGGNGRNGLDAATGKTVAFMRGGVAGIVASKLRGADGMERRFLMNRRVGRETGMGGTRGRCGLFGHKYDGRRKARIAEDTTIRILIRVRDESIPAKLVNERRVRMSASWEVRGAIEVERRS